MGGGANGQMDHYERKAENPRMEQNVSDSVLFEPQLAKGRKFDPAFFSSKYKEMDFKERKNKNCTKRKV